MIEAASTAARKGTTSPLPSRSQGGMPGGKGAGGGGDDRKERRIAVAATNLVMKLKRGTWSRPLVPGKFVVV